MSAGFGGAQTLKRPTIMTAGCLGPYPAARLVGGVMTDVKLKEGDTQHMVFQADDLPPWYALNTPKEDTPTGEFVQVKIKEERKTKTAELMAGGRVQSPVEEAEEVPGMTIGFVGKPKGSKTCSSSAGCSTRTSSKATPTTAPRGRAAWWTIRRAFCRPWPNEKTSRMRPRPCTS